MPESRAQVLLARAVLSGKSHKMPRSVAAEIVRKMHGRRMKELPAHKNPFLARRRKK